MFFNISQTFILLGIVVMVVTGQEMWPYIFVVGTFMAMEVLWELLHVMYRNITEPKAF